MIDREKAIKGLKHELQNRGKCGHYCRDGKETVSCEYDKDGLCIQHWGNDALALLKAQEPRVIQFDEIDDYEVLWMEVRDVETEDGIAPWVKTASGRWFSPLLCSEERPEMILSTPCEYGKICRCWTSRPTDAQRAAEPWPKEEP